MTLNTFLSFSAITIFTSCNGQKTTPVDSKIIDQNATTVVVDTTSVIDSSIFIIFQDRNNNFWFGSNGQGVYRYDPSAKLKTGSETFIHFTSKDGLSNNQIRGIQEDQRGNIYINTLAGISKYDGKTFTQLIPARSNPSSQEWKIQPGDLWFNANQDSGVVYRYDGTTLFRLHFPETKDGEAFISKFPRSKYPNMIFNPYDVYSIYKDSKGNIWFGTSNLGVCRYDGKSFTWISEGGLSESPVRSICEDIQGYMWFGNSGQAVYRYDGKSLIDFRREKGIGNLKDHPEDFPVSYMSMVRDSLGALWIATYRCGVWRYDGENLTQYPLKDGSKEVTVFSIYKDNRGDLWLGTPSAGAYKFNGESFEKFKF